MTYTLLLSRRRAKDDQIRVVGLIHLQVGDFFLDLVRSPICLITRPNAQWEIHGFTLAL